MLRRSAIALVALSLLAGAGQAQEQEQPNIHLEFETLSPADPTYAPFWADHIERISPDSKVAARIYAATMPTSKGGTFAVTMFFGGGTCGLNTCDVRVIEDGEVIASFPACDEQTNYELKPDGSGLVACDTTFDFEEVNRLQQEGAQP